MREHHTELDCAAVDISNNDDPIHGVKGTRFVFGCDSNVKKSEAAEAASLSSLSDRWISESLREGSRSSQRSDRSAPGQQMERMLPTCRSRL